MLVAFELLLPFLLAPFAFVGIVGLGILVAKKKRKAWTERLTSLGQSSTSKSLRRASSSAPRPSAVLAPSESSSTLTAKSEETARHSTLELRSTRRFPKDYPSAKRASSPVSLNGSSAKTSELGCRSLTTPSSSRESQTQ